MLVDILRPIPWAGGASFRPVSYSEDVFRMENTTAPGQRVPAHVHDHMTETFVVEGGSATFWIGPDRRETHATVGDRIVAPLGEVHAFACTSSGPTTFDVEFRPAADMARMMAIIAGLQDDGESSCLMKFLYVERREGLRTFSRPIGVLALVTAAVLPLVGLYGRVMGWERLVGRYTVAKSSDDLGSTA